MNSIIFKIMMLNEQIKAFRKDEKGVTMIEYGLLAALIAVVCIAVITTIGTDLNSDVHRYRRRATSTAWTILADGPEALAAWDHALTVDHFR